MWSLNHLIFQIICSTQKGYISSKLLIHLKFIMHLIALIQNIVFFYVSILIKVNMYVTFQQQNYSKTLQNKCNKVIENISNIVSIKIYNIRKLISLARETLIKEKIKKIKKIECLTHQIQWLMKKNTK